MHISLRVDCFSAVDTGSEGLIAGAGLLLRSSWEDKWGLRQATRVVGACVERRLGAEAV